MTLCLPRMRLNDCFLWSVLIFGLCGSNADVVTLSESGRPIAAVPIFTPSSTTAPGVYSAGLQTFAGDGQAIEESLVPVALTEDSSSVSAIMENCTAVEITFVAAGKASAYLSTLRQFQATGGEFNPGRAFGGIILTSSSNTTVAMHFSTSPSEPYVLLLRSSSGNTTGKYSLRTSGQEMDGISGGLRLATLLLPGQFSVLGTVANASSLTYVAQVSQMEGRNISVYFLAQGKGEQLLLSDYSTFPMNYQPNQIISAGQSSSYALSTSGQNFTVVAYSKSAVSNFQGQASKEQNPTTFTFDFTMTGSPAVEVVPPLLLAQGASPSAFSVPTSSGLAGILVPQAGQDFSSTSTRNAAALLGVGAIAPLPGTVSGSGVQGPDGQIILGPFDTPSLPMQNNGGNAENSGTQANPPVHMVLPVLQPPAAPPAGGVPPAMSPNPLSV